MGFNLNVRRLGNYSVLIRVFRILSNFSFLNLDHSSNGSSGSHLGHTCIFVLVIRRVRINFRGGGSPFRRICTSIRTSSCSICTVIFSTFGFILEENHCT